MFTIVIPTKAGTHSSPSPYAAAARYYRARVAAGPAYLEFFGYGLTTPEELRAVAKVSY